MMNRDAMIARVQAELKQDTVRRERANAEHPELEDEVVGFRAWRTTEFGELRSQVSDAWWTRGDQRAVCRIRDFDSNRTACVDAPVHECSCGLYARYSITATSPTMLSREYAVGIIQAWGRMELHPNGLRAQYMRIGALLSLDHRFLQPGHYERLRCSAKRYGVPLLTIDHLEDADSMASEYGDIVPIELRPRVHVLPGPHRSHEIITGAAYRAITELQKSFGKQAEAMSSVTNATRKANDAFADAIKAARRKHEQQTRTQVSSHFIAPAKAVSFNRPLPTLPPRRHRMRLW